MNFARTMLAVAGLALCASVAAQSYPSRPVTILNGFPPGGPTDTVLRLIGTKLSERLGQSVVIENRAGAAGNIAGTAVALADPELKGTFAKWDIEPSPGTPEAFGAYIAQESARWKAFVARSNLRF